MIAWARPVIGWSAFTIAAVTVFALSRTPAPSLAAAVLAVILLLAFLAVGWGFGAAFPTRARASLDCADGRHLACESCAGCVCHSVRSEVASRRSGTRTVGEARSEAHTVVRGVSR